MDRRRFLENSAKMAASAALFLELADHLYPGSVFRVDPLEKAGPWLEENGWSVRGLEDRSGYIAHKYWRVGAHTLAGAFSFTTVARDRTAPGFAERVLRQVQYQAHHKEKAVAKIARKHARRFPPGMRYGASSIDPGEGYEAFPL